MSVIAIGSRLMKKQRCSLNLKNVFETAACAGRHRERGHLARKTNAQNCAHDFRGQNARSQ
jgi:hypothetical protein